jgi:hypothetical protein
VAQLASAFDCYTLQFIERLEVRAFPGERFFLLHLEFVQFVIFFGWSVPHQALDKQYKLYIFFLKKKAERD